MSPPNAIHTSDPEDEIRELVPNTVIPDFEDEHMEEELDETHPIPSTTLPESEPSLRVHPDLPDNPLMTFAPTLNLYLSPSPSTVSLQPISRRWTWFRNLLNIWRREEGRRIPQYRDSSITAPVCPITGEPTHHTIPLLMAHSFRHDTQIEHLEGSLWALPSPEDYIRMEQQIASLAEMVGRLQSSVGSLHERIDHIARERFQ